jgi:hypothetical protein
VIVDVLALLSANACIALAGVGALRLVAGWRVGDWASLGLAYTTGVACVGVLSTLALIVGLALTIPEFVVLCLALFAAGFLRSGATPAPTWRERVAGARISVGVTLGFLVLLGIDLVFQPLFRSDAWAQWAARARALVELGGLDPAFFGAATTIQNPDYPLLVPALEAVDFRFMGFDTRVLHLQFGLLFAGFLLALVALCRDRAPAWVVTSSVAAVALAPALAIQTASAYADVPLGVFVALAGVSAWRWLAAGERASLALLGVFSAGALATKVEGIVFIAALFAVLVPLVARRSPRAGAWTALVGAIALVGIVPWRVWVRAHDVPAIASIRHGLSPSVIVDQVGNVRPTLSTLLREIFDPASWLLLVPLALVAVALAFAYGRRRDCAAFALGSFALTIAGLILLYWTTPYPITYLLSVSADRTIIAPVLFLASLAPFLLAEALAARPAPVERRAGLLADVAVSTNGSSPGREADVPLAG